MAGHGRSGAGSQQAEAVVQSGHDLLDGEGLQSSRGQFDRQRDAIQSTDQLRYRQRIAAG